MNNADIQKMVFYVLVDSTDDKEYIKKSTRDGSLAFYDTEKEADKAKDYNGSGVKVVHAEYIRLRDYEDLKAGNDKLVEALTELRDWYLEHTGLPAVSANAALASLNQGE